MFLFRRKVPKWECPQGYHIGQPLFYEGWLEDRAFGLPVVKQGVHNPMLPNAGRKKFDVAGLFGGGIVLCLIVLVMLVALGNDATDAQDSLIYVKAIMKWGWHLVSRS